jgi:ABC-type amino acid transport substrate-binding protein
MTNVNEVVVTGPDSPKIASVDDLSGKSVFVRKSSSYYETSSRSTSSLRQRKAAGDAPGSTESLEDEDLLEMLDAGLIP